MGLRKVSPPRMERRCSATIRCALQSLSGAFTLGGVRDNVEMFAVLKICLFGFRAF